MTEDTEDTDDSAKRALLSEEAAKWFVRLRDDCLSPRQRHLNVQWLKQSPVHIAELVRVQQLHKLLRATTIKRRPPGSPEPAEDSNVVELTPRTPKTKLVQHRVRFGWQTTAAYAALLAVSLLFGFIVKVAWFDRTIEAELGQWRTVSLSDGSTIRVGPGSKLRVSFGDQHRTVRLIRGEAMFDVAKDRARPFLVTSELVGVLAVGTQFRVARQGGRDVVAVTEGTVAVYDDGRDTIRGPIPQSPASVAAESGAVAVTAGEQVAVAKAKPVTKQKVNVDYELAWSEGWLMYEDRTIEEVAGEFNRRNRVQIAVDEAISARRIAFFRGHATDPESFATALAVDPEVECIRESPMLIRVTTRESSD